MCGQVSVTERDEKWGEEGRQRREAILSQLNQISGAWCVGVGVGVGGGREGGREGAGLCPTLVGSGWA